MPWCGLHLKISAGSNVGMEDRKARLEALRERAKGMRAGAGDSTEDSSRVSLPLPLSSDESLRLADSAVFAVGRELSREPLTLG